MKAPFIYAENKKRYKKLFCISVLQEDIDTIEKKKECLVWMGLIKDGKKEVFGLPTSVTLPTNRETQLDVLKDFIEGRFGANDLFVDEKGTTDVLGEMKDTVDIYFEQY